MQLKHLRNLLPPQEGASKICCLAWSPNNAKLAVCTYERVILLYDDQGERKDKFATKPVDPKFGKKSYMVKGIAFSPDSTKIAIGQTDEIVFVYKIGEEWSEKKSICNKFPQQSAVTCLVWPPEQHIIFGTAEGKIRIANVKTNKSSTLYDSKIYVVSIAVNPTGKAILSGHADGSIIRYFFDDEGTGDSQGKICVHPSPPYALAWGTNAFMAAGCDKRVFAYGRDGRIMQQFDYSREDDEHEFTGAICSPSGQSVVIGSYDRLRIFNWSPRKGLWDEGKSKEIKNLYTVTALAWKRDGSCLVAGSLCGGVELFDCCLKKTLYKNKFEITHVGLSQVIVKNLSTGTKVILKSFYGYEIDEVRVMGNDRYIVAHTSDTLLLADLQTSKLSEIAWHATGGNEKYFFEHENVCIIFNAGEMSLIEYGVNEILGSMRTEFTNPHLMSVRINERKQKGDADNKKMAYLVDLKTIAILDLITGATIGTISHDSKIGWLELNETGHKLLFRDQKLKLHMYDIDSQTKTTTLNYCSYVQWVPGSDVVVAQNRGNLCVWYNMDAPERITMTPIKGDVLELQRQSGKTEVIVNEGITSLSYALDEGLIEFGTAIDDKDYVRAAAFLETLEMSPETEAMWKTLSRLSLESQQLVIAERCFAALGDISKAQYLHKTNVIAEQAAKKVGGNGFNYYKVQARMAIMDKNFKLAESIYLEQNEADEAIEMYKELHKWDDAINVAQFVNHPKLDELRSNHYKWLMGSGQESKAGEVKEREGDEMGAINLYMKAAMPAQAARVIASRNELLHNSELVNRVASALVKSEMHERAGDLFEKANRNEEAMQCYRKGQAYRRAVELARQVYPQDVVRLEEEWGNYLVQQKQLDAAINHFIEAGATVKAVDAAINSRQWLKAVQILEVIPNKPETKQYYRKIAEHHANIGEYEVAEKYYLDADNVMDAINMYNAAAKWEDSYRLACTCMKKEEIRDLYVKQAQQLEAKGRYKDSERMYTTVGEADQAIGMYKRLKMYKDLVRLVKQYHPNDVQELHQRLAKELDTEGNHRLAEYHYIEGKDWKSAVNMYRTAGRWEDAYRVAKSHGGPVPSKHVAFMWANTVGGDGAVKLLTKFGLLEDAINYSTENLAFEFAFDLAKTAMKEKIPEIQYKHALYLEDSDKLDEAEAEFINCGKAKEAVLMYVNVQNWDAAQRVAEKYDRDSLTDVLIGQARSAFQTNEYQKAESFLLRAQRPELAIKYYREVNMWDDALRVCKEYLPDKLDRLQEEYDKDRTSKSNKGSESLVQQARDWESKGEHTRAVECYLKVTSDVTSDPNVLQRSAVMASEIAIKFLSQDKAVKVVQIAAPRLIEQNRCVQAAELYLKVDMIQKAVDAFIVGEEWNRAKKVARELEPRLESYVDEKYKQYLKDKDKLDALEGVDVDAALERYINKGEWLKAISIAEQKSPMLLHKYVAQYAANLIKDEKVMEAMALYVQHGAPAIPQNYNIYRRIFQDVVSMPDTCRPQAYKLWSDLRDILHNLCTNISSEPKAREHEQEFEAMFHVAHYSATRSAALPQDTLQTVAAKLSVSLLRYSDILPPDKAFYEAGMLCKAAGMDNVAFVLLNRYLDLVEAIEDQSLDALDNSAFESSDIPLEIPLPENQSIPATAHEEVKEWVLAISMDQKAVHELPMDERGVFEGSLTGPGVKSQARPCVITGYPVLGNGIEFKKPGRSANKEDWNKLSVAIKTTHSTELQDVFKFLGELCGTLPTGFSL